MTAMRDSDGEAAPRIFVDRHSKTTVAVIGLVAEDDFVRARSVIPEWREYSGYEEWRESREGFQIGLVMAGVEVKTPTVVFTQFLDWCRDTRTLPGAQALEAFAARSYDLWPVLSDPHGAIGAYRH